MTSKIAALTPQGLRTIGLGILSFVLYLLLFVYEQEVLKLSLEGAWGFTVPIVIAFVFSFVHGSFTGGFWDMLGLKAKKRKES